MQRLGAGLSSQISYVAPRVLELDFLELSPEHVQFWEESPALDSFDGRGVACWCVHHYYPSMHLPGVSFLKRRPVFEDASQFFFNYCIQVVFQNIVPKAGFFSDDDSVLSSSRPIKTQDLLKD